MMSVRIPDYGLEKHNFILEKNQSNIYILYTYREYTYYRF